MKYAISLVALLFGLGINSIPMAAQGRGNTGIKHGQAPKTTGAPKHTTPPKAANVPKPRSDDHTPARKTATSGTTKTTTVVTAASPTIRPIKNPNLEAKLQTLLPPGTNVQTAALGFKNWGQFVAAVHVSNNLNIPFADLKTRMTGPSPMSLGQAIQSAKVGGIVPPPTTIRTEVKRAEKSADDDFRSARNDRN